MEAICSCETYVDFHSAGWRWDCSWPPVSEPQFQQPNNRSSKIFEYKTDYYERITWSRCLRIFVLRFHNKAEFTWGGVLQSGVTSGGGYWPLWRPHLNWNLYYTKSIIISHVYVCRIAWRYVLLLLHVFLLHMSFKIGRVGVRLSPLGTSATYWPYCTIPGL
jgi:hypothetical protein